MFSRRAAALSALLFAPIAVYAAAPGWAEHVGLDVWNVPTLREEVEVETRRGHDLSAHDEDIRQRIEVKEILVADLIAGRATLAEVTAQFLALNRGRPYYMETLRETYPAATDEQTTALAVLGFVTPRLADEPLDRQAEVSARLEAELSRIDDAAE